MIPVTIGNNTYKSISEAWREESPAGLAQITVRWRLKQGWSPEEAFLIPPVNPIDRRTFGEVRRKFNEVLGV